MRLQLLPSAVGCQSALQFLSTYVLNRSIAIDGGGIGLLDDLDWQRSIRHLLLTHAHIDHLASVGIWLDNLFEPGAEPPTIYCTAAVANVLRTHYFNDQLWPNLLELPSSDEPSVRLCEITPGESWRLENLIVEAVEVNHTVPTVGYILSDGAATIVFSADTAATDEIWRRATAYPNWCATVLEVAFPDDRQDQAIASGHLTPATFAAQVAKMPADCVVYAVHLKSAYRTQILAELNALELPNYRPLTPDDVVIVGRL